MQADSAIPITVAANQRPGSDHAHTVSPIENSGFCSGIDAVSVGNISITRPGLVALNGSLTGVCYRNVNGGDRRGAFPSNFAGKTAGLCKGVVDNVSGRYLAIALNFAAMRSAACASSNVSALTAMKVQPSSR